MLADFIEMYASSIASAGAGSVTMAQVSGRPKFSTALGTASRTVKYVIEDTTTGAFERGIGLIAADVLTRSVVRETWNGSGLVRIGATPLAFTASAQNIRVRISPQSDDAVPTIPQIPAAFGTNAGLISGHFCTWNFDNTTAPTNDFESYFPFRWDGSGEIDQIGVKVTTAQAGGGLKLGIYAMQPNGLPGVCLMNTNNNPLPCTATGFVSASMAASSPGANIRLAPGWYWIGYIATSNGLGFTAPHRHYVQQSPAGFSTAVAQNVLLYRNNGIYATGLPADASGGNGFSTLQAFDFFVFIRPKIGA